MEQQCSRHMHWQDEQEGGKLSPTAEATTSGDMYHVIPDCEMLLHHSTCRAHQQP